MTDHQNSSAESESEARVQARLAWNGWPDSENSRREIAAHEARDPLSAKAWDRVVCAITKSAPSLDTSQHAEMLPYREAAGGGADTNSDGGGENRRPALSREVGTGSQEPVAEAGVTSGPSEANSPEQDREGDCKTNPELTGHSPKERGERVLTFHDAQSVGMREALEAIVIRCKEGDKKFDWLETILDIAERALAAQPPAATAETDEEDDASYERGFRAGYEVATGQKGPIPQCSAGNGGEPVSLINRRLTDLAEANSLYGNDQRLGAPDKIARNNREISWLKELRSIILTEPQGARLRRGSMAAQWTYDPEAEAYYFAPMQAAKPPYLTQRHVDAILDIASDGTLAGIELIDRVPPPPTASLTRPELGGKK